MKTIYMTLAWVFLLAATTSGILAIWLQSPQWIGTAFLTGFLTTIFSLIASFTEPL